MSKRAIASTFLLVTLLQSAMNITSAEDRVRFNRDVRPILSDKCFHCHGPDGQKRQAGLRLDVRASAIDSGALVPGEPSDSDLLARITSTDPEYHMPPARAKLGDLTAAEVDVIKRWIAQGAEYEPHWAFIPLQPVEIPQIDALIRSALAKRGLPPRELRPRRPAADAAGCGRVPE
jgi:hypothetical protein